MSKQKVIKTGNSLALTIPAHLVSELGIAAGDIVQVTAKAEESRMVCAFRGSGQLTFGREFLKGRSRKK